MASENLQLWTCPRGSGKRLLMRTLRLRNRPRSTYEYANRIGAGAFDYDFGALDGLDNPLTRTYDDAAYVPTLAL